MSGRIRKRGGEMNKDRKFVLGWAVTTLGGFNALITAIYLNQNNLLENLIWFFPIITMSTIMAMFALDAYSEVKK